MGKESDGCQAPVRGELGGRGFKNRASIQGIVDDKDIQRRGWIVLFAMLFCGIVVIMNQYKVPVFMTTLIGEFFPANPGNAGWLMSTIAVAGIVTAFPSAFLLNSFGPKKVGLVGLAFMLVGVAVGATATTAVQLLIGRLLEGVAVAMTGVVATTVISMYFPRERAGLPMGIWNLWYVVGAALAYTIGVPIAIFFTGDSGNWHAMWWFSDVLVLIAFIVFALFVSKPKEGLERAAKAAGEKMQRPSILEGLKVKRMWIFGLGFCLLIFTSTSVLTWVPTYVQIHEIAAGATAATAGVTSGVMSSIGFAAAIPVSLLTGVLLKKFDTIKQRNVMCIIAGLMTLLYSLAFLIPYSFLPYYLVILGMESGWTSGVVWAMVPITMPKKVTIPIGSAIIIFFQGISNLLAMPLLGYAIGTGVSGVYNWTYAAPLTLATSVLGTIAWVVYTRTKPPVFEEQQPIVDSPRTDTVSSTPPLVSEAI